MTEKTNNDMEVVELLERLNSTLGSIRDMIQVSEDRTDLESKFGLLKTTIDTCKEVIEDHTMAGRLVRLNRELSAQLDEVRKVVFQERPKLTVVNSEEKDEDKLTN